MNRMFYCDSICLKKHEVLFPFFFVRTKKKPNPKEESAKGCRIRDTPFSGYPTDTLMTVSDLTKEADDPLHSAKTIAHFDLSLLFLKKWQRS
ncbi:hypothetical protein LOH54_11415 [Sulfurimonas sp. HSL-3221]|uniref:hypothetical protein n=1 Tax=Sulfurimonadaceae TaxID=2771471 RepID=UPI001E2CCA1E|nr:hypothetical protein [Sulfurimonas sp. HSL-3221]UFS62248.1 hypothetical protein LOH54_11415 [Sulfurimonas sp. HSL-3221]